MCASAVAKGQGAAARLYLRRGALCAVSCAAKAPVVRSACPGTCQQVRGGRHECRSVSGAEGWGLSLPVAPPPPVYRSRPAGLTST